MSQWHRIRVTEKERDVFMSRLQQATARMATLGLLSYGQSVWRRLDLEDPGHPATELFLAPGTYDLLPAFLAGSRVERCDQPRQEDIELVVGAEPNCRQWWR